ncbi:MAG TPA: SNF2-related protein, partial [Verrucomicrobiaceae bacterium]
MLITEKILGDIAGWQAMKAARRLVAAQAVEQSAREGDVFRGLVREGKRKFAASLTVQGPTKADARCACADAQHGLVCAHAIAVALATLSSPAPASSEGSTGTPKIEPPQAPEATKPLPRGKFDIFIPGRRLPALREGRGQLPVFLQFQPGGNETDPVARWLVALDLPVQSGPLSLDAATAGDFFTALRDHPRVWDGKPGTSVTDRRPFHIQDAHDSLALRAQLKPSQDAASFALVTAIQGAGLAKSQPEVSAGPEPVPLSGLIQLRLGESLWAFDTSHGAMYSLESFNPEFEKLVYDCLDKKSGGAIRDLRWLAQNLDALEQFLPLETDEALSHLRVRPAEPHFIVELDGSPRQATARVEFSVGSSRQALHSGHAPAPDDPYPIPANDGTLTFWIRNASAESRMTSELESSGFIASADGNWILRGEREVAEFFSMGLPRLRRRHEVIFTDRWLSAFRGWQRISPVVRRDATGPSIPQPSRGWLDMEFSYEAADGFRVPRHELLRLLRGGQSTMRGRQGQVYVLDTESCDDFESLLAESGARLGEGGKVGLTTDNAHVLNDYLAAGQPAAKLVLPDEEEMRRRLGVDFSAKLRTYQLEGVRWLIGSVMAGRGALLADDMGLGKTLQIIALLRWMRNCEQVENCEQPSRNSALVVCPTSLIHNWFAEIQKFTSDLPVHVLHGPERTFDRSIHNEFTVFLTSYALLTRDIRFHHENCYQALILDESSHVRNPETAAAKAVCELDVPVRVALSGTPVENSVRDLWSLMRFVQPGLFGGQKEFHEHYAKPLAAAESDPATAERAARRLRIRMGPFVLRRTKKEVLRELPD